MWTDGRTDDGQKPVTKAHLSNQVSYKKMLTPLKHTREESSPPQEVVFALCAEDGHIDDVPVMSFKDKRT
ncbi:hypothetical protein DPMN_039322 [Dreissena polymorpha]|uniref:Uncharacterized protein n=1 Tax=Dreissena polymorpha TaxID=45954 RepID=A0A9D4MIP6_DREPO|nr:hypothetical protein DPMN_039322 [Dreissena polymorpha]